MYASVMCQSVQGMMYFCTSVILAASLQQRFALCSMLLSAAGASDVHTRTGPPTPTPLPLPTLSLCVKGELD